MKGSQGKTAVSSGVRHFLTSDRVTAAKAAALLDYVIEWGGDRVAGIKTGFNAVVKAAGFGGRVAARPPAHRRCASRDQRRFP